MRCSISSLHGTVLELRYSTRHASSVEEKHKAGAETAPAHEAALHESDLPAKLCHRSELPGRNQSPDAVEEAGLSSAGVHRWQDNSGGVRRSRYLDERRR